MIHNQCGKCKRDFSNLSLFDLHRVEFRITSSQQLVGNCTDPLNMGLREFGGTWFTEDGYQQALRMSELGKSRAKS